MAKRKLIYLIVLLSTLTVSKGCPFEEIPGNPYKYRIKAANINSPCAPGTKFSLKSCACVSAPDDPRLKSKQATRSKFPGNDVTETSGSNILSTSHSIHNSGRNLGSGIGHRGHRKHLFSFSSNTGTGHSVNNNVFSGSFSATNQGHGSIPSNQLQRSAGFVGGEPLNAPSTDSFFSFPPNESAGDWQTLPAEPVHPESQPKSKPIHAISSNRRGNQIQHTSFSIHPGSGSSRISSRTHVSGHHGNARNPHQSSSFSFINTLSRVPKSPQDLLNWHLPQTNFESNNRHGFDLSSFQTSTGNRSPFDIPPPPPRDRSPFDIPPPPPRDRSPFDVPPPPPRDRLPFEVPPPAPPKSIEHRLYVDNEKLSSSRMNRLRPKPVHVNKSDRRPVSQHTLDMIRAWFTGGYTPSDVQYTDHHVPRSGGRSTNVDRHGDQFIDKSYPSNKQGPNTGGLLNPPIGDSAPRDIHGNRNDFMNLPDGVSAPRDLSGNTNDPFNLPSDGSAPRDIHGNRNDFLNLPRDGSAPRDLSGNTNDPFNLPSGGSAPRDIHGNRNDFLNLQIDGSAPHDLPGNTNEVFDLSSISETGGGTNHVNPINEKPSNTNNLIEIPFLEIPINKRPKPPANKFPLNTDNRLNLPPISDKNAQKGGHILPLNTNDLPNLPSIGTAPRDLSGNTDQLFDLSSISDISQGGDWNNPLNPEPSNRNGEFEIPILDRPSNTLPQIPPTEIPRNTENLVSLPPVNEVNTQNGHIPSNDIPPLASNLFGFTNVGDFLNFGNGHPKKPNKPSSDVNIDSNIPLTNFENVPGKQRDQAGTANNLHDLPPFVLDPSIESFGLNEINTVGQGKSGSTTSSGNDHHIAKPNLNNVDNLNPTGFLDIGLPSDQIIDVGGHHIDTVMPTDRAPVSDPLNGKADNGQGSSGTGSILDLSGHVSGHVNPNEFVPIEGVTGNIKDQSFNGQGRSGTGQSLDVNGHISGHVNPTEFVPIAGVSDHVDGQNSAPNIDALDNFDVINLLNGIDVETLLDTIGAIPVDQIDTKALRLFQRKVNQLIEAPKEQPKLMKLINAQALRSEPNVVTDNSIQHKQDRHQLTLSAKELSELHQKLQREIEKIDKQEAERKARAQSLAQLKAEKRAQNEAKKQAKKERMVAKRLAKQRAKQEKKTRQEKAKMERKARQQKAKLERQARREKARMEKKARQEAKRKQRQERKRRKRLRAPKMNKFI